VDRSPNLHVESSFRQKASRIAMLRNVTIQYGPIS
jgi:hypothetical protein